ncbi:prepilin-type N-terminal cleavage/methylation domain-containing protein [Secundilactobacillus kimchicus]|uniref:competence type IV pilus major pilin ComGC n=1 Tax=Secundilactobacillus kimchicus TaxID=528209 RepID=UPI003F736DE3
MTTILKHYAFVPGELRVLIETGKPQAEVVKELTALADLYYDRLTARFEMMMTWIQPISFFDLGGDYYWQLCQFVFTNVFDDWRNRLMKNRKPSLRRGFTLIEMAIVLFIVALLILIVVPNLSHQKKTCSNGSY